MNQNINMTATIKMHRTIYKKNNCEHIEATVKWPIFCTHFQVDILLANCSVLITPKFIRSHEWISISSTNGSVQLGSKPYTNDGLVDWGIHVSLSLLS